MVTLEVVFWMWSSDFKALYKSRKELQLQLLYEQWQDPLSETVNESGGGSRRWLSPSVSRHATRGLSLFTADMGRVFLLGVNPQHQFCSDNSIWH